jgi:hypothetical protein
LDFDETYAPVARLESNCILLAYATYHGFKLYQMDVKSGFLIGPIKEEVYVEQPPGFKDSEYPNHVYKFSKALYGLKQAQEHGMNVCEIFLSLMASKSAKPILLSLLKLLQKIMIQKFEMSMMGELKYFLGFQIKQLQDGTFISQTKYIQDILKKFGMKDGKPIKTPWEQMGISTSTREVNP